MDLKEYSHEWVNIPCNLCKSNDTEVFSHEQRFGTNIPVVICKKCGLIYLNPRWPIETYQEFYKRDYRKIIEEKPINLKEYEYLQRIHGSKIFSFCSNYIQNGSRVLDIGCSCGGTLFIFQKFKNCIVKGVEPNLEHADYVRNNLKIDIDTNYFEKTDFPNDFFDLVILTQTINHLYNPTDCLEKIRQILKPDGKLFLEVNNYPEMVKRGWNPTQVDHIFYFTPETLECMVRKVGFEPLDIEVDTKQSSESMSGYMKKRVPHIHIRMLLLKSEPENTIIYPDYKVIRSELDSYLKKSFLKKTSSTIKKILR